MLTPNYKLAFHAMVVFRRQVVQITKALDRVLNPKLGFFRSSVELLVEGLRAQNRLQAVINRNAIVGLWWQFDGCTTLGLLPPEIVSDPLQRAPNVQFGSRLEKFSV